MVKYNYSAYGEILSTTGRLADTIGSYNPFKYKGYYYDYESQMYYCKSRYYVPEWCRWLNSDDVSFLKFDNICGMNLFAYCFNNPVIYSDGSGHFPVLTALFIAGLLLFTPVGGTALQILTSVGSYAGIALASIWDKDIRNDMNSIGWNPFNSDENRVLNSNSISFYKGIPVFQISGMGGSMSLGAIWFDKSQGVEVLKHERGHNIQLMAMGLGNYLIQIGIPSMWKNGDDTPWELSASLLGGSKLANNYSTKLQNQAHNYFIRSMIPIVNIYNIFQYIFY